MMDVDRFKQINDRFGHQIGDRVIASVGNVLRTRCRETDVAGRYGGDELCLVLPHTDLREAVATGEKIRRAVAELAIDDGHGRSVEVTCSIGAASVTRQDKDPEPVLLRADRALYRAKQEGRNRVATWPADDGHRSSASGC
jgi:diguanylate cyclase (GGDEF)-like protein